ncbi:sensor histidine kinase [Marinobacter alexandrii]|uniref:sensor histidine kinase n=1 Tax=Marinobacter alexandrii TaxID=2570351 RepID=UPI0032998B9E
MGFKNFSLLIGIRVFALVLVLGTAVYLFSVPGYPTLRFLVGLLTLAQLLEIVRFVSRTNAELTRFLDVIRYADFGQRFKMQEVGAGFEELGEVFTGIIERFQNMRTQQEESLRHLKALMEHVPVPLLSVHIDGKIRLHNNAARRLFGSVKVERLEDLRSFGEDFYRQMSVVAPGERRLAVFLMDIVEQRLILSATEIIIGGEMERLVSLQNIQSELDGVQLQAWQDLVRVLTHEIMNSITPVASLAETAVDLVEDATSKVADHPDVVEELADVKSAVETVARRSDGLLQFVQSYRQLTRLPTPNKQPVEVSELFANVAQLVATGWETSSINLAIQVEPESLQLTADADMLEQVLLNLLKNAEQALVGHEAPSVSMTASLNRNGHVCLEVADNGPGIDPDLAGKIFVPFFTTKRDGSGVGLALTRQVMLAHGGSVALGSSESGGAKFSLTF